jgi:pimeloyl-ACP methyl ester carboxylesterase
VSRNRRLVALGATLGAAAAEHLLVARRRRNDPAVHEPFGACTAERVRALQLPDGASLHVEETGSQRDRGVIFVHGSGLRSDVWHYQKSGIAGHRLVFYDLRGHGRSRPKGSAAYTVDTLADDLDAVRADAGLEEVVLVGHSLGGMVVLDLCARRGQALGASIRGIVLVNTTHRPPVETMVGGTAVAHFERLVRKPFDLLSAQSARLDVFRRALRPSDAVFWAMSLAAFGPRASPSHVDFAYDMLAETPTDLIFDLFRAYRHFDVSDHLLDLAVPALVVAGTHDRLTMASASEHIAAHMPKAELVTLEGGGHLLMLERHREFNAMLARFVDDTLGPADAAAGSPVPP